MERGETCLVYTVFLDENETRDTMSNMDTKLEKSATCTLDFTNGMDDRVLHM